MMRLLFILLITTTVISSGASLGCGESCSDRISAVREARQEYAMFGSQDNAGKVLKAVGSYCDECSDNPRSCATDYIVEWIR